MKNRMALVKIGDKLYLFTIDKNITLTKGERVLCETQNGEIEGICFSDIFNLENKALEAIAAILNITLPLKPIIGKYELLRF